MIPEELNDPTLPVPERSAALVEPDASLSGQYAEGPALVTVVP